MKFQGCDDELHDEEKNEEIMTKNMDDHVKIMNSPDSKKEKRKIMLLQVFLDVCKGMAFMHNNNFIHRDLKPRNIFLKS